MTKSICNHEVNIYVSDGILKVLVYNVYCQDEERLDPTFYEPDHQLSFDMSSKDPIVQQIIWYLLDDEHYETEDWEEHDDWFDLGYLLDGPPMLADWADGIPRDY